MKKLILDYLSEKNIIPSKYSDPSFLNGLVNIADEDNMIYNTVVECDEIYYKILFKKQIYFIKLDEILVWLYSKQIKNIN